MNNRLSYKELFDQWMQDRSQPVPEGLQPLVQRQDAPEGHFMKTDDMQAVANAWSPFDLYQHPDKTPIQMDYYTSALNIHNRDKLGVKDAIVLNAEDDPRKVTNLISVLQSSKENYRPEEQPYAGQGIYEHEVGHYFDPRLRSYAENRNDGYTTRYGLSGDIGSREYPGIHEEDKYWDRMRGFINTLKQAKNK